MATCPVCSSSITDAGATRCKQCGVSLPDVETRSAAGPPSSPSGRQLAPVDDARFAPGQIFGSRYRIVSLLGRGGMGEVYRADDLKLGQQVALKLMMPGGRRDERSLQFLSEVRLARTIAHPNVCRVYDLADAEGWQYLSMEYVDGETLASLIRRIGRLPPDRVNDFARQLFAGVTAAHDRGVLHRDLKPSNVMVDGRGSIRIMDFGLAVSATGALRETAGTPAYMAPEQLIGDRVTERTDLYALGLILYELLTGRALFAGQTLYERVVRQQPHPSIEFAPDVDARLTAVIAACLDEEPSRRPPSAAAVVATLPGGDPLAAAVAEGRVPSPEMVAAATKTGALALPVAWCLLVAVAASLIGVGTWAEVLTVPPAALPKPAQVLAERCREILRRVGHTSEAADSDFWFAVSNDRARPSMLTFVYRQSPRHLVPRNLFRVVGRSDPPATEPGMAMVSVDASGRLVELSRLPDENREGEIGIAPEQWAVLFAEAGLDKQQFAEVDSPHVPLVPHDQRQYWQALPSGSPPVRVTTAALGAHPVYFAIDGVSGRSMRDRAVLTSGRSPAAERALWVFVVSAFVAMAVMARRNLRASEGDRVAAKKVALFVIIGGAINALLRAHHVPLGIEEAAFVLGISGWALVWAGFSWLAYISFEPYVRRLWPRTLISWTRLLNGQLRDPLVGRDVLIGTLAGVVLTVILIVQVSLSGNDAPRPPLDPALESLASSRLLAWSLTFAVLDALQFALGGLFFVLVVRMLVRHDGLAIVVASVVAAPLAPAGISGIAGIAGAVAFYLVVTTVATRIGLLAAAVALLAERLLTHAPLTLHTQAWLFGSSLVIMLLVMSIATYGFLVSLAGRPALGEKKP